MLFSRIPHRGANVGIAKESGVDIRGTRIMIPVIAELKHDSGNYPLYHAILQIYSESDAERIPKLPRLMVCLFLLLTVSRSI